MCWRVFYTAAPAFPARRVGYVDTARYVLRLDRKCSGAEDVGARRASGRRSTFDKQS